MTSHYSVGISHNRPLAVFRKLVLRHFVTRTTNGWRWRIMAEETQLASGICKTHTQAKDAKAIAAAEIIKARQ